MQPRNSGYREVLGLRDCKGGVARSGNGREALRALLRGLRKEAEEAGWCGGSQVIGSIASFIEVSNLNNADILTESTKD
jgi:hypothetical protein